MLNSKCILKIVAISIQKYFEYPVKYIPILTKFENFGKLFIGYFIPNFNLKKFAKFDICELIKKIQLRIRYVLNKYDDCKYWFEWNNLLLACCWYRMRCSWP